VFLRISLQRSWKKGEYNYNIMKKIKEIFTITLMGYLVANLFIIPLIWLDTWLDNQKMDWEYVGLINLFSILMTIILGFISEKKKSNRLIFCLLVIFSIFLVISMLLENPIITTKISVILILSVFVAKLFSQIFTLLKKK
jgi:MFS-type transporter involved in bile tolerance (Atg22 family)